MSKQTIPISHLDENTGQIQGLPANPRFIRDEKFTLLKKSLEEHPEMLDLRELLVYPHNGRYVIIGGNMRHKAAIELGFTELPCKVVDERTPIDTLQAYIIKDNASFGAWNFEMLANEWDSNLLNEWGIDVWDMPQEEEDPIRAEVAEDEAPEGLVR